MNKIVILLCIVFFITGTFFFINDEKNENNHLYLNTANLPHIADQTSTQAISINVLSPLIAGETVTIQINSPIPVLKNNIAIKKDDHSIRFSFNNNQVQFTPQQTGIHTLQISTKTQALFSLHVDQSLPFSTDHIQVFNQADSLENALGLIINQFWIGSSSLSQDHLHAHIKDQALTVIGSDADLGFLIEIDPENTEDIAAIHALKNTKGIDYVFQRLYEGEQLDRLEAGREPIYPNDYPSWTMGYTENWHLVHIDAPRAWRYTTGNPDVQIGVADGGFDTNHPELQGRVAINLYPANQKSSETQISHGTAVAGAIAASAGNQYGMTGLNFTSPLVLHRAGFRQWVTLAKQPKVKVISASWAIPQHIPNNLNLNDANQVKKRAEAAFKLSRSFRAFAEKNPDKLFIFSAGNGIGNGQGYKGHYAVNGRLHSPALHLSSLNTLSKVPNVMFVSALTAKGPISFSSTYGELVDIAAPAYYKSLSSNNGFKTDNNGKYGINGGFKGTSSAAPVVAGVASLIYSINPNLQGHEVKALLLESAKEKATQRFINYQSKKTEHLAHPIPILHADKALSATYQYLKKNTKFTLAVADPVKRTIHVTKNGKTTKIYQLEEETQALVLTDDAPLQAKEEQTNDPDLALDDIAALKLGEISFNIKNAESQQVLNNVSVHISRVDAHPIRSNQFTAITYLHEGISPLILPEGKYQCQFSLDGFAPLTKILNIQEKQLIAFDILLMPLDEKNLPTIQGQVTTPQGKAIPNAEVSIVLGNHISAPITIMQTNEEGDFALGLPKELISHLSSLKLIVHAEFFQTHIQEILDFDNQNSAWIEIQLAHEPLPSTVDDSND